MKKGKKTVRETARDRDRVRERGGGDREEGERETGRDRDREKEARKISEKGLEINKMKENGTESQSAERKVGVKAKGIRQATRRRRRRRRIPLAEKLCNPCRENRRSFGKIEGNTRKLFDFALEERKAYAPLRCTHLSKERVE